MFRREAKETVMMTRFGSVDDLLASLKKTRFPFVGIPFSFGVTFPLVIKVVKEGENEYLEIKGERFLIVKHVPELLMDIISIPGN